MTGEFDRGSCRSVLLALLLIYFCGWTMPVFAQSYPAKSVMFVSPGSPGGASDRLGRVIGDKLSKLWGVPVIFSNRPGGGGTTGPQAVARSAPDGYTVLFAFTTLSLQAPVLFPNVPYHLDDFSPVTLVAYTPVFLAVRADSAYRTLPDLLSMARNPAAPLSYGTISVGSSYHIYGETLARAAKAHLMPVAYKGEALAMTDLLGGQIQSTWISVGTLLPQVRGGKLRALAVVGSMRSTALPDVPTFAELGLPGLDTLNWFGFLAPAGTSKDIVKKLSVDINWSLQQPEVIKVLHQMAIEPAGTTPEQFAEFLHSDSVKWNRMIREAGIKIAE